RVDILSGFVVSAVSLDVGLVSFLRVLAGFDSVHHLSEMYELVADNFVVFIETEREDIALCPFEVTYALLHRLEDGADLRTQSLTEVLERRADRESALGERGLAAAVRELLEDFAHCDVDRVADKVGVERFEQSLALKNLGCHCGRVGHARAAAG